MRDNQWLASRLDRIWYAYFYDVERANNVLVRFRGKWKNKFGHIKKLKQGDTEIVINSLFKDERVPEFVIDLTLAHELVHYMHGFNSPLPKKFQHPHRGNVVNRELIVRGFKENLKRERFFMKEEWPGLFKSLAPERQKPNLYDELFPRKVTKFKFFFR
ncbi:MAG: hypothetical protein V1645_00540 [archaeon]